jgi:hypothetical protein
MRAHNEPRHEGFLTPQCFSANMLVPAGSHVVNGQQLTLALAPLVGVSVN